MPCENSPRKRCVAALAFIGALQAAAASAAEPAKEVSTRRGYDFTRPEPGAILPNPTQGVGTPPQLREYVTVHAMTTDTTQAGGGDGKKQPTGGVNSPPGGLPAGTGKAAAAPAAPHEPLRNVGQAAQSGAAGANPASGAAAKPPSAGDYVRKLLAEQVAAHGISGPFTYRPSGPAETDAALAADEQGLWNGSVARLASSWQNWQASHRVAPDSGTAEARSSNAVPGGSGVETAPGRIVLSGAPPGVTGDLPDVVP